jgi:xanthine dehydrogenase/oxidase
MNTTNFFYNCYEKTHFTINAKEAITNAPANTWCRAPGTVEGIAMIENIMEHIAMKIKKDPLEVRLANIPGDSEMKKYLQDFAKSTGKFLFLHF